MPDFWMDADSLIRPYREAYRFNIVPKFWEFLEEKAQEQVIASSELVLQELEKNSSEEQSDELLVWAKRQQGVLFLPPTDAVQQVFGQVAESVKNNKKYAPHWIQEFLDGADPWIIAHAKALGGRIVTFEKPEPNSKRVKIPDVAAEFGVKCINLWDMLTELKAQL